MKIRSITYFCNPGFPLEEEALRLAGDFLAQAKAAYESAGYEVQTVRIATVPFPELLGEGSIDRLPDLAASFGKLLHEMGVGYVSLGPALPSMPRSYEVIPEAIAASEDVFFGGVMADRQAGIHFDALKACAQVIVRCAPLDPNGFANLRFAALANVPAGSPFFPAAYHSGGEPCFAVATESADLAVAAFQDAATLEDGRRGLIAEVEKHGRRLTEAASTRLWHVPFGGIDFSLAPFPDDAHSLGAAVEKMGVPLVGLHGSLAAAAILTEAVDRADFPHTGFSGFMQPLLEDSVLTRRSTEGTLSVKDTLLYSAVCGTGLDTIPLPGDTTGEQITPLLLDLSALALRLDKPLTARLLPIPGKKAGDATAFDFAFFANGRVMPLESEPLRGPLAGAGVIPLGGLRFKV